jgi:hypothetical protein
MGKAVLLMVANQYVCEVVMNPDTQKHRAEIYELPERELMVAGPWQDSVKQARKAAVIILRALLYAAEGVQPS